MASRLYYDPARPSAFKTLKKPVAAAKIKKRNSARGTNPGEIEARLLKQVAYTMHRQIRKCFPRNPYSVNNVMEFENVI